MAGEFYCCMCGLQLDFHENLSDYTKNQEQIVEIKLVCSDFCLAEYQETGD